MSHPPLSSSLSSSPSLPPSLSTPSPPQDTHTPLNTARSPADIPQNTVIPQNNTTPSRNTFNVLPNTPSHNPSPPSQDTSRSVVVPRLDDQQSGSPTSMVQSPQTHPPERGSYLDMDEDELTIHPNATSRLSALNPFRLLQSNSQSTPERKAVSSPTSSPPTGDLSRSSDDSSRPLAFPSLSSPESPTFSIPETAPAESHLSPTQRPRRQRPSIEGVFDSALVDLRPSPPEPSGMSSPVATSDVDASQRISMAPSTSSSAGSGPTVSSNASRQRRLPPGENPLIFGGVVPRRISKSVPLPAVEVVSSSVPRAPALSITSPTPQPSPSKGKGADYDHDWQGPATAPLERERLGSAMKTFGSMRNSPPKTVTYVDEVGRKSLGKRKSEELDAAATAVEAVEVSDREKRRRHSARTSSASNTSTAVAADTPPSSFPSTRRHSKRIKLAPGSREPSLHGQDISGTTAAVDADTSYTSQQTGDRPGSLRAPSTIAKSRTSRPPTRASFLGANSSQGSLPLSAIMSPRPPSVIRSEYTYFGRDGVALGTTRQVAHGVHGIPDKVSWRIKLPKKNQRVDSSVLEKSVRGHSSTEAAGMEREMPTPTVGLLFYPGFFLPLLWFIGAALPNRQHVSRAMRSNEKDADASSTRWDQQSYRLNRIQERTFKTWRDRCRFMAIVSLVTYLPLIVLIAVFVPK